MEAYELIKIISLFMLCGCPLMIVVLGGYWIVFLRKEDHKGHTNNWKRKKQ